MGLGRMENRFNNNLHDTASIEQAKLQCFANLMCMYAASEISTNLCRSRLSEHRKKNPSSCSLASCSFFQNGRLIAHTKERKKRERGNRRLPYYPFSFLPRMNPQQSPPHNPPVTRHAPIHLAVNHADLVRPGATRGGNGRERQRKRNGSGRKSERERNLTKAQNAYT